MSASTGPNDNVRPRTNPGNTWGHGEAARLVKKTELMNLLLLGLPLYAAAKRMEISTPTACRYARDPQFLQELKKLSEQIYKELQVDLSNDAQTIKRRLEEESDAALDVLAELMKSEKVAAKDRIVAANSVLDRNMDTARGRKIEGNLESHHTIDATQLMHAAETAREIEGTYSKDGSSQHQLPEGITDGNSV